MIIAVIGSRSLTFHNFEEVIPTVCTEIVSGGAKGIDTCARLWAEKKGLVYTEFLPDYKRYGKAAPLIRNRQIVDYADAVLAIWDKKSKGTYYAVEYAQKQGKPIALFSSDSLHILNKSLTKFTEGT